MAKTARVYKKSLFSKNKSVMSGKNGRNAIEGDKIIIISSTNKDDEDSFNYDGSSLRLGTVENTTDEDVGAAFVDNRGDISPIDRPFKLDAPQIIVK